MRNVRSALLVAVVGLSLTTACSYSSSRSWGSTGSNTASPDGHHGKGKPALNHGSKGKPAQQTSEGKPAQASKGKPAQQKPAPAPAPQAEPVPEPQAQPPAPPADPVRPPREGRDDEPTTTSGKLNGTIGTKPPAPRPNPDQPIGTSKAEPPKGLRTAPAKPTPPANKASPIN